MASALPVSGLRQREGMPLGRVAKVACHVRAEYSRCPPGRGRRRSRSRETAPPWFPSLARSRPNSCTVSGFVPAARPRLRYSSTSRSLQSTMAPLEHRLPDAGTTPKGHDHRSSRLGEDAGPDFGGSVTISARHGLPVPAPMSWRISNDRLWPATWSGIACAHSLARAARFVACRHDRGCGQSSARRSRRAA